MSSRPESRYVRTDNKGQEYIYNETYEKDFIHNNCNNIIIVTILCVACATTNRKQNDRKKLEKSELISKAICNRDFKINVQTAHPTRGMSVTLTADFNIRVKSDSVVSYLPYFGRAYNVPYGGGKALNFSGVTQDYKITQPKRDKMHMEFSVKNEEDMYKFYIDVFDNGKASINVMPQQRERISFNGEIELYE